MARKEERPRLLRLHDGGRRGAGLILDIALAVVRRGRSVLVAQRPQGAHQGGAWEFPGGKVEDGEEPETAALRELEEETGLHAAKADPLLMFVHDYPDRRLRFHVFLVDDPGGEVRVDGDRPFSWADAASLDELAMPEANRAILRALRWRIP